MLLPKNLRYLRKMQSLTQSDLAQKLGLKRGILGAYEEGRADPRLITLQHIAQFFAVSVDHLLFKDLSTGQYEVDYQGATLRVLPIITDRNTGSERATVVPVKASAGYLQGYGDTEYIEELHSFSLPFAELPAEATYRLFQISGESMLPIPPGAYVIGSYVQNWRDIRFGERYVLLTINDGVVFKRVFQLPETGIYQLVSDNRDYKPYRINREDVLEVWKARGIVSFDLDAIGSGPIGEMKELGAAVERIERALKDLKQTSGS